jgi:transketolase
MVPNIIGYGLPTRAGTAKAHGEPPGDAELDGAKDKLGWPKEPRFLIPGDVLEFYHEAVERGREIETEWTRRFEEYRNAYPELAAELKRRMDGVLPEGWDARLPAFPADAKGMATRSSSGKVLDVLAAQLPELIGGSADLTPSNNTKFKESGDFARDNPAGRYLHFGVREHAMGAALNGLNLFGGLIAYGGTFLVFSDYMKPAIRIAALSRIPSIFVFTHDSVGLGEDGPTHQPIEHLVALRAVPYLTVIRPADANEVAQAWKIAISHRNGPYAFALTRQNVPTLEETNAGLVEKGAYVLKDFGEPEVILMASGSEVSLILEAAKQLFAEGHAVRVVSFPSWELFELQDETYRESVLPKNITARLAVEAGATLGWERYASSVIGLDHYGASAPYKVIFERFGFTVGNVVARAKDLISKK